MAVRRFRSIEELERPASLKPGDPEIVRTAALRWQLHRFLARGAKPRFAPGLRKFRSVGEKQQRTEGARDAAQRR